MCCIFSCCGWALDFFQRVVTFILACILSCIITIAVLVAIAAGVAYGYNYSMAEFLTFTRHDTTVYMRRGQFYDKPDFDTDKDLIHSRRFGDPIDTVQNFSMDSMDSELLRSPNSDLSPQKDLSDAWSNAQDTRRYVELLTKFSKKPEVEESILSQEEFRRTLSPPPRPPSLPPSLLPPATLPMTVSPAPLPPRRSPAPLTPTPSRTWPEPTRSSYIPLFTSNTADSALSYVMRKFPSPSWSQITAAHYRDIDITDPEEESRFYEKTRNEAKNLLYVDEEQDRHTKFFQLPRIRPTVAMHPFKRMSLPPIAVDDEPKMPEEVATHITMRYWTAPKSPHRLKQFTDYKEDIDEENVVYKPI